MHLANSVTLSLVCLSFWSAPALAFDPNGWCLPADACMGSMKPISDFGYDDCEGTCRLGAPVEVVGMNATLFDRTCKGDWGANTERVLFIEIGGPDSNQTAFMLTNSGIEELKRCL
ncbi:hypothetical protein [Martelella radicis]|uniref:Uncharacterized protein n=1 Tax=Martelella radicis TaxID=1397476 RepID=A0A7W6KLD0_9HYPH|nr:hypothetical protein [Martelella radicis]MBB4123449.1 hypothetical protein [Martelella radicis]